VQQALHSSLHACHDYALRELNVHTTEGRRCTVQDPYQINDRVAFGEIFREDFRFMNIRFNQYQIRQYPQRAVAL
jgi:hypothetical protein